MASPTDTLAHSAATPVIKEHVEPPVVPEKAPSSPPKSASPVRAANPVAMAEATIPVQAETALPVEAHPNPKVNELRAMFPTIELSVIELVLETCNGSTDRSIEQLLGMTDPNFKPDELGGTRLDHQVDLDADFARSLQMQDEEEYRRGQQQYEAAHGSSTRQLPYQPRVRRTRPSHPPQGDDQHSAEHEARGDNPPGLLQMEDKIERFAEAGKQTFTSLLSKAKAKYSEFQATQAQRSARNNQNQHGNYPSDQGSRTYGEAGAPGGSRGGEQNRGSRFWDDHTSNSSRSDRSESVSLQSTLDMNQGPNQQSSHMSAVRKQSRRWQPSDAFDDPLPPRTTTSPDKFDLSRSSTSPSKQGKIDPAKLGILPKKRVDLLSASSPSSSHPDKTGAPVKKEGNEEKSDPNPNLPSASLVGKLPPTPPAASPFRLDSDDELEYTKNPFDER
ncbi:hypothetical protein L204_105148 [Cryptococcus depauperatus]